ncbi:rhomboid family intramembrane serine protease [Aggregicoccus sp. 17bor-14]|uniref:rhomboid family intramembrane serine protease n=1 Tax=Myxococcaceae TaxID=31 RepID=UPI00129C800D|nr:MULTISPECIES: rhomboid family intramembrane serine protease [Myxococcaceae]MBF5043511.1 rhomboid family intramembrane serine protease [Simulacricoccus sp. 17bor-14]MRI89268.1 rhomboid family intramembrane serine protease [Aggregicoccus sp. 17bor-14]
MIPISDDNPTLRTPVVTYLLLALNVGVWLLIQGAGFDDNVLAATVCNLGMVPGELTRQAQVGLAVPLGPGLACVVDRESINTLTPLTSMFLHGSWMHLLGNCLFLWVFGNNVEDSMGRVRFFVFYIVCGLAAAFTHVMMDPGSPVPTVGASGAISGVMGAYLLLYPRVRVRMFFPPFFFIPLPAWLVLIWWFGVQLLSGLPRLNSLDPEASSGVAFWAHVGGFVAGAVLVRFFEDRRYVRERTVGRHRLHPDNP